MPLERLIRVRCDRCQYFLPKSSVPSSMHVGQTPDFTPLFISEQDAVAAALARGWSAYPLMCQPCNNEIRGALRDEQARRNDAPQKDHGAVRQPGQGA